MEVIKLITKDSIDEDMLNIGMTKLQLDDAVGGDEAAAGDGKEDTAAKEVRKSLLTTLRNKFEAGDVMEEIKEDPESEMQVKTEGKKEVKKARGSIVVKDE